MPKIVDTEQRRAELAEAAARLIARRGLDAATMREVATEAGCTTGAVTHYFADKHELLATTFEHSLAKRISQRPPEATNSARQRLHSSLIGALPMDESRRTHWLVTVACCIQASGDQRLADIQHAAYVDFHHRIASLISEAGFCDPRPAARLAEQLIAAADGIAVQALMAPGSWPPSKQRRTLLALVDRLLTSDAAQQSGAPPAETG